MEGGSGWGLGEAARRDRRGARDGRAFARGDRDSDEAFFDAVLLDELPRAAPEVVRRRGGFDAKDLQALPQPRKMGLQAKRRPAVYADRLEATVSEEEAAVPNRDARLFLRDERAVKPRVARLGSPPRGLA